MGSIAALWDRAVKHFASTVAMEGNDHNLRNLAAARAERTRIRAAAHYDK